MPVGDFVRFALEDDAGHALWSDQIKWSGDVAGMSQSDQTPIPKPAAGPFHLVWTIGRRTRTVTVPFTLKDIAVAQ